MKYGYEAGLIDKELYSDTLKKYKEINELIQKMSALSIVVDEKIKIILSKKAIPIGEKASFNAGKLLKRPEITIDDILPIINEQDSSFTMTYDEAKIVEMSIKYDGYIKKDLERIKKLKMMENKKIPATVDYSTIQGLKNEAREKLKTVRPETIGQAMRISGVDPSDISIVLVHIESLNKNKTGA